MQKNLESNKYAPTKKNMEQVIPVAGLLIEFVRSADPLQEFLWGECKLPRLQSLSSDQTTAADILACIVECEIFRTAVHMTSWGALRRMESADSEFQTRFENAVATCQEYLLPLRCQDQTVQGVGQCLISLTITIREMIQEYLINVMAKEEWSGRKDEPDSQQVLQYMMQNLSAISNNSWHLSAELNQVVMELSDQLGEMVKGIQDEYDTINSDLDAVLKVLESNPERATRTVNEFLGEVQTRVDELAAKVQEEVEVMTSALEKLRSRENTKLIQLSQQLEPSEASERVQEIIVQVDDLQNKQPDNNLAVAIQRVSQGEDLLDQLQVETNWDTKLNGLERRVGRLEGARPRKSVAATNVRTSMVSRFKDALPISTLLWWLPIRFSAFAFQRQTVNR